MSGGRFVHHVINHITNKFTSIFLLFLLLQAPISPAHNKLNFQPLVIPAAGRTASLGSLYDHTRESFPNVNILRKRPDADIVTEIGRPHVETVFGLSNTLTEKAKLLKVSAEAALSFNFLQFKGKGMVDFLQGTTSNSNSVKGTLIFSTTTKARILEIFFTKAREYISQDVINLVGGTHFVVGIEFGASLYITFEDQNESNVQKDDLKGELEAAIAAASKNWSAGANVSGESVSETVKKLQKFDFSLRGDINLEDNYPTSLTQVIDLIVKFPSLVKESNGGDGAQKTFYLLPLQVFQQWLNVSDDPTPPPPQPPNSFNSTNSVVLQPGFSTEEKSPREKRETVNPGDLKFPAKALEALLVFEHVDALQLNIADMVTKLHTFRRYVDKKLLNSSALYKEDIARLRRVLSKKLSKAIVRLRNGTLDMENFEKKWTKYLTIARRVLLRMERSFETEFRDVSFKVELVRAVRAIRGFWISKRENVLNAAMRLTYAPDAPNNVKGVCLTRYIKGATVQKMLKVLVNVREGLRTNHSAVVVDCDSNIFEGGDRLCSKENGNTIFDDGCEDFNELAP